MKISVISARNEGTAIAQTTILTHNLANEIAFVDALPDKLRGKALDMQHPAALPPRVRVVTVTKNSDLVIITAGARQIPDITPNIMMKLDDIGTCTMIDVVSKGDPCRNTNRHTMYFKKDAYTVAEPIIVTKDM
ncbi:hypothetical protein ZWY2020_018862 [Hordeum vulgare]|nr:hypothetical protein ZWY2020_018862 [Hordeum vulgare]